MNMHFSRRLSPNALRARMRQNELVRNRAQLFLPLSLRWAARRLWDKCVIVSTCVGMHIDIVFVLTKTETIFFLHIVVVVAVHYAYAYAPTNYARVLYDTYATCVLAYGMRSHVRTLGHRQHNLHTRPQCASD